MQLMIYRKQTNEVNILIGKENHHKIYGWVWNISFWSVCQFTQFNDSRTPVKAKEYCCKAAAWNYFFLAYTEKAQSVYWWLGCAIIKYNIDNYYLLDALSGNGISLFNMLSLLAISQAVWKIKRTLVSKRDQLIFSIVSVGLW